MPFFENTTILCRDLNDFDNYSTMKIEIAFMSNLERPITATAAAWQPGLLEIFSTTNRVHSISLESFENQISAPVTRNICLVFACLGICMLQASAAVAVIGLSKFDIRAISIFIVE